jgi:uncharacterized protein DUF5710
MRHWLDVPYSEKDAAKARGARWDPAAQRWYAPRPGMHGLTRWAARPDLPALLPGEDRTFGSGLFVDLVPSSCWFTNARSCISQQDWERVRRLVTSRAGHRCEVCRRGEDRATGRWLEAHERWEFDPQGRRQILRRLVCLCTTCHSATHFGLAQLRGEADLALTHLCTVTGMSLHAAQQHISAAFAEWERRSRISWGLDLSMLTSAGITLARPAPAAGRRPQAAARALIRQEPPAPRPPATTYANRPRKPGTGSRWERWLKTGER